MKILILDTETTDVLPDNGNICEVAVIHYSIEHGILNQLSLLLPVDKNPAQWVNKISPESTAQTHSSVTILGLDLIAQMIKDSDAIVAHNAIFDKQWCEAKLHSELGLNAGVKWICSLEDIQWPEDKKNNKSLIALAVAYGVPVVSAHRALTDCELLAKIFDKVRKRGKLKDLIATASIERFTYKAILSYDERSKAKEHGFRWIADKKHWVKKMSEDEANAITFEIKKIG